MTTFIRKKMFCKKAIFIQPQKKPVILFFLLMLQSSSSLPALWINLTIARSCGVQVHSSCWVFILAKGVLRSTRGLMLTFCSSWGPFPSVLSFSANTIYSLPPHKHFLYVFITFFFFFLVATYTNNCKKCSWHFRLRVDRFVGISLCWRDVRRYLRKFCFLLSRVICLRSVGLAFLENRTVTNKPQRDREEVFFMKLRLN